MDYVQFAVIRNTDEREFVTVEADTVGDAWAKLVKRADMAEVEKAYIVSQGRA